MKKRRKMKKADNKNVDIKFLQYRFEVAVNSGYPKKAKWIEFCETLLDEGYTLRLYEARETVSKYITISKSGSPLTFKVRFSNHRPIHSREVQKDCDFFVGVTNLTVTNTQQALIAVRNHFKI